MSMPRYALTQPHGLISPSFPMFLMSRPRAFSLLELLVAIAVVSILLLIAVSGVSYARDRSKSFRCVGNLRQIGAATMLYIGENNSELPYYYYLTESNDTGSGAYLGTWYYNLAPYLGVPRTELNHKEIHSERTKLGTVNARIAAPCVFTCPAHRQTELDTYWLPKPMTWPTDKPVSYAPLLDSRGNSTFNPNVRSRFLPSGIQYFPVLIQDIPYPSRKVWISDSPRPDVLNTSDGRWQRSDDKTDWAYQAFTRHYKGGNALFYDGHVEWIPIDFFLAPGSPPLVNRSRMYFNAFRDPAVDQ